MGGFFKGIVTGVVSFGLGFAVLSVLFPVEETPGPVSDAPVARVEGEATSVEVTPDGRRPAAVEVPDEAVGAVPEADEPSGAERNAADPLDGTPDAQMQADVPAVEEDDPPAPTAAVSPEAEIADAPAETDPVAPVADLDDVANAGDSGMTLPAVDGPPADVLQGAAIEPDAGEMDRDAIPGPMPGQPPAGPVGSADEGDAAPGDQGPVDRAEPQVAPETAEDPATPSPSVALDPPDAALAPPPAVPEIESDARVPDERGGAGTDEALPTPTPAPGETQVARPGAAPTDDAPVPTNLAETFASPLDQPLEQTQTAPLPDPDTPAPRVAVDQPAPSAGPSPDATPDPEPMPEIVEPEGEGREAVDPPANRASEEVAAGMAPRSEAGPGDDDAAPAAPAPQTLPRVQPMPSGAPGVTVRRGGAGADDPGPESVEGVTVGRLPVIGAPQPEVGQPDEVPPAAPLETVEGFDRSLPAYLRYGALVEPLGNSRPLGVLLFEDANAEAALVDLPMPVTLAMDPFDPDAPRRARVYREAGHEIVLLARNIPPLATPADLAITFDAFFRSFPETVAVMDVTTDPIASSRTLAREVALMLESEGYGVIARRRGLDAFLQAAHDAGLAATGLYRVIDESGQSPITMRRLIDRAAFEAERAEGILIAGSAANAETLAVLSDWMQDAGRDGVTMVPASVVLTSE